MRLAVIRTGEGRRLTVATDDGHLARLDHVDRAVPQEPVQFLAGSPDAVAATVSEARSRVADPVERRRLLESGGVVRVDDATFAAPVADPRKVVCLALNYQAHADEGGLTPPSRPVIFLKGPNSICAHDEEVVVPPQSRRIDHEGELALVIGRRCRGLTETNWRSAVAGFTIMNDLTARDLQLEDIANNHPWDFTKSFDTYGPIGPWLVTSDEMPDPQGLQIQVRVDGQVRQQGSTADMIFGVGEQLAYISSVMTLEPGDVVATGTCEGIGPVPDGSSVEVQISGLGTLRNRVRFEESGA